MTRILVAGATGLVGRHALSLLLADERVERVVAPTRRPLSPHPKLTNPVTGFDPLPADAPYWAADGILCALGTTRAKAGSAAAFRAIDLDLPIAIAKLVRSRGASRFALASSMGANPASHFLYPRTKGELELALAALGFESLTIVRPSLIGGEREENRRGESLMLRLFRLADPLLPRKLRISPAERIAEVLVEAAIAGAPGRHVVLADALAR
jgi:uncharacterized protein YbjT (DUF2867 family)